MNGNTISYRDPVDSIFRVSLFDISDVMRSICYEIRGYIDLEDI